MLKYRATSPETDRWERNHEADLPVSTPPTARPDRRRRPGPAGRAAPGPCPGG
ncbi:hypothetical protein HMPREF0731_2824, partial [Pseudoroseomonas cervicalis ATCC 49957]